MHQHAHIYIHTHIYKTSVRNKDGSGSIPSKPQDSPPPGAPRLFKQHTHNCFFLICRAGTALQHRLQQELHTPAVALEVMLRSPG